jgi:type I restriction enzyme, S subunit
VAKIVRLAGMVEEAKHVQSQVTAKIKSLHLSVLNGHFVKGAASWTTIRMEDAVSIHDRQVSPTLPQFAAMPHISGENMESETCRLLPYRTAEADGVKSNNYLFSSGSILYSKIRPYLRKAIFVDFDGVCSADVYPIRVINRALDPHFVKWTLVAEPFTEYANRLSGRTRMPKLNRKQLFGFRFSYPSLSEQRAIVRELEALQVHVAEMNDIQSHTQTELNTMMPAIFDRAFKGEM